MACERLLNIFKGKDKGNLSGKDKIDSPHISISIIIEGSDFTSTGQTPTIKTTSDNRSQN